MVQGLAERGFARLEVRERGPGGGLDGLGLGAGHLEPLLQKAGHVLRRGHGSGGHELAEGRTEELVAEQRGGSGSPWRRRRGGGGAAAEHFGPTVAQDAEAQEDFLDRLPAFFEVGLEEAGVEIVVEAAEVVGDFAAGLHVEVGVHFLNDGLGAQDIIVDGLVDLERVAGVETGQGPFQKADGAVIEHEDQVGGRGGLGGDFAIGVQGLARCMGMVDLLAWWSQAFGQEEGDLPEGVGRRVIGIGGQRPGLGHRLRAAGGEIPDSALQGAGAGKGIGRRRGFGRGGERSLGSNATHSTGAQTRIHFHIVKQSLQSRPSFRVIPGYISDSHKITLGKMP